MSIFGSGSTKKSFRAERQANHNEAVVGTCYFVIEKTNESISALAGTGSFWVFEMTHYLETNLNMNSTYCQGTTATAPLFNALNPQTPRLNETLCGRSDKSVFDPPFLFFYFWHRPFQEKSNSILHPRPQMKTQSMNLLISSPPSKAFPPFKPIPQSLIHPFPRFDFNSKTISLPLQTLPSH